MKHHIDLKFVYESRDIDDTHQKLKDTLKQIINTPNLDIFLKNPNAPGYGRLMK